MEHRNVPYFFFGLRRNYFVILFDVETISICWCCYYSHFCHFICCVWILVHFDFSYVIRFFPSRIDIHIKLLAGLDKIWQFCCCCSMFSISSLTHSSSYANLSLNDFISFNNEPRILDVKERERERGRTKV